MTELTFENAVKKLEEIAESLERGNLPLEDSIKLFAKGTKLVQFCSQKLNEAEKKIEILLKKEDGEKKLATFDQQTLFGEKEQS